MLVSRKQFHSDLFIVAQSGACQPCAQRNRSSARRASPVDILDAMPRAHSSFLPPDGTLVESKLLALQDVPVAAAALAGAGGNDGVQTRGLELPLDGGLDLALALVAVGLLLLHALALLHLLLLLTSLLLASAANALAVVGLVPLPEGSGIDLDDGGLGQGVCADQLVVGRVVGDGDDTALAGDALGAPGEVAGLETEATELAVAATGADKVDALRTDTGVGGLATLLEGSVSRHQRVDGEAAAIGLCVLPLLAVGCALGAGGAALVTGVTRDTVKGISIPLSLGKVLRL